MSEYTPGPWAQDKYGDVTSNGKTVRVEGVALAGRSTSESRANARLIASAPDLLEALQMIGDAPCPQHVYDWLVDNGILSARAKAIAKATGND